MDEDKAFDIFQLSRGYAGIIVITFMFIFGGLR